MAQFEAYSQVPKWLVSSFTSLIKALFVSQIVVRATQDPESYPTSNYLREPVDVLSIPFSVDIHLLHDCSAYSIDVNP